MLKPVILSGPNPAPSRHLTEIATSWVVGLLFGLAWLGQGCGGGNDRVRRRNRRETWIDDGVIATRNRKRFRTQGTRNRGAHCGIGQFHTLETMRTNLPNQVTLPNARDNGTGSVYGEADLRVVISQFSRPAT